MTGPNFFIIGAAKAATTSLSSLLAAHPDVTMARPKEPHFFSYDSHYLRGWHDYVQLFAHGNGSAAVGEASTSYSRLRRYPRTLDRMSRHVPNARVIYMVRHPLERIEAAYIEHLCTASSPVVMSINEAILAQPMLIDSSRYWEIYTQYSTRFGAANVEVVWFEDYISATVSAFERVCRFLSIADVHVPDMTQEVRNSRAEIRARLALIGREHVRVNLEWSPQLRQYVVDQLRDDNIALLNHFDRPSDYWPGVFG